MTRTRTFLRRTTLTAAMVGAVAFGSVAIAPAASADEDDDRTSVSVEHEDGDDGEGDGAVDGSFYIVDGPSKNGPVAFLVTDRGRSPVFFCDPAKPNKRHNVCQPDPASGDSRR